MEAFVLDPVARRHDVPAGAVPRYREFLRQVWAWRGPDGRPAVNEPPWMYSMLIHEPAEIAAVSMVFRALHRGGTDEDRLKTVVMEDGSEFSFMDLAALHAFLRACAALGATNETAGRVCECVMWTLGFRWV